jgi:uncharacterized membrane protein YjjB (DUF3815 family)
MSWLNLLFAGICGAGAAATLSYCSNISKKDIFWGGIVGGLGWFVYSLLIPNGGKAGTESYFWGSIAVALLSEVLAFLKKNPATVYLIPGLLPLVPGSGMFQTMQAAVQGNLDQTLHLALKTLTAAGATALAVAIIASLAKLLATLFYRKSL